MKVFSGHSFLVSAALDFVLLWSRFVVASETQPGAWLPPGWAVPTFADATRPVQGARAARAPRSRPAPLVGARRGAWLWPWFAITAAADTV